MITEDRKELRAELAHARKGMQYYVRHVRLLEKQLSKLQANSTGKGRADPNLPRTTMEFWLSLLGKRPKTTEQVLQLAVKALGLQDLPSELIAKLRLRWSVAVITLVKQHRIQDEGAGRTRTFRLPSV